MSIRHWVAAIAFGLILAAQSAHAQDDLKSAVQEQPSAERNAEEGEATSDDSGSDQQPDTMDPTPALERIESAIRDLVAEEDEIERQRQMERDGRDLDAQEAMAKWAFWMFVATAATVILTFIALVAIVRTLHHTRRAADYAKEGVEITQQIGQAEVSAYVYCTAASYERRKDSITVVLELSNVGNSPASDVAARGKVIVQDVGGLRTMPRVHRWVASKETKASFEPIAPRGKITDSLVFFWDFDFTDNIVRDNGEEDLSFEQDTFVNGNTFCADVVVSWRDVFRRKQETTVALDAIVSAHPFSPNKKRSRKGVFEFRTEEAGVSYADDN